jgi:hypothetical protein
MTRPSSMSSRGGGLIAAGKSSIPNGYDIQQERHTERDRTCDNNGAPWVLCEPVVPGKDLGYGSVRRLCRMGYQVIIYCKHPIAYVSDVSREKGTRCDTKPEGDSVRPPSFNWI